MVLLQPEVSQFLLRLVHLETSLRQPMLTQEVSRLFCKLNSTNDILVEQEVARQKILPFSSYWARNSPYGTPVGALTFHWIFSVILILASECSQAQALFELFFGQTCWWWTDAAPNRDSGDGMYHQYHDQCDSTDRE